MKSGSDEDPFADAGGSEAPTLSKPPTDAVPQEAVATVDRGDEPADLTAEIVAVLDRIDEKGRAPQISVRTAAYTAVLDALEERDELEATAERLAAYLDADVGEVTRSRVIEPAIGAGLGAVAPDVLDALREARRERAAREL